ncbi:MAG: hypothetical protein ACRC49_06055 [Plesiomonas sp.]
MIPVGSTSQALQKITRIKTQYTIEQIEAVRFVPLVHGEIA